MSFGKIKILLILLLLTYIEAQKETSSDEQVSSNDPDDQKQKSNDTPLDKKDKQSQKYKSLEVAPDFLKNIEGQNKIDSPNERSDAEDNKEQSDKRESDDKGELNQKKEQTKLPMNCIQDYKQFCKTKFFGYKFKDGCHDCKCRKKDFCDKGECKYYVKSFEEAADYCTKIEKENKLEYIKQMRQRNLRRKTQKKLMKSNITKVLKKDKKIKKVKEIKKVKKNKKRIVKHHYRNWKNNIKNKELKKVFKSIDSNNSTKETHSRIVNFSLPLKIKSVKQNFPAETLNLTSSETNEEKPSDKIDDQLLKDYQSVDESNKEKVTIKKQMNISKTGVVENELKERNISSVLNKNKVIEHPIKISLSKISKHSIIKAMIYQLAKNELAIDRTLQILKKSHSSNTYKRKFLRDLLSIKKKNSRYKMEILKIVKKEMIKNKVNGLHAEIGKHDMTLFNSIYRKLVKLNKVLKKIRSHYLNSFKRRRHRKKKHNHGSDIKTSFIMISVLVFIVTLLCNN